MPTTPRRMAVASLLATVLALCTAPVGNLVAQGQEIGFAETFALADDRAATLARLIPGTSEHFLYTCLLAQHEGRFDAVPPLLTRWIERHGRSAGVREIENRQALLTYADDPAATFEHLRERLGLSFNHQRRAPGVDPELPTRLDPALLDPTRLRQRALRQHRGTVDGFRTAGLWDLARAGEVPDELLTPLLHSLGRTAVDLPNLPRLVLRQLDLPQAGMFGILKIHSSLLREQLDACLQQRPALLDSPEFVSTYLLRLRPNADVDWRRDAAARGGYLDELAAFVDRLAPAFNSLKAHVHYHRLVHDLAQGRPDRQRFLAYLRLPRAHDYVAPGLLATARRQHADIASPDETFLTGLPPTGDDEPLVRSYLEHFLVDAADTGDYAPLLREDWLRRVFAETKILHGVGDMQRWYARLDDPDAFERLRERVEVRFAPTAAERFAVDAPVRLPVEIKNVDQLLVKVFEIDTYDHLRTTGEPVDAGVELDGLIANAERTLQFDAPPFRRVSTELDLPEIERRPGVWVVELIGGGVRSRAVVRRGGLRAIEQPGAAGHEFHVFDQDGQHLPAATLWFGGKEYRPGDDGVIVVPYGSDERQRSVVLRHGAVAGRARFRHLPERYALEPGLFVARESLLRGGVAKVVLQPHLIVQPQRVDRPISVELLEEVVLRVVAVDLDGVRTVQEVRDLTLHDDRDTVHPIRVPDRLAELRVSLHGTLPSLTTGETLAIESGERVLPVNDIDGTAQVTQTLLARTPAGYALDVLGKDGEPRAGAAVELRLELRDFTDDVAVTLRSDAGGRVELGALPGVRTVHVLAGPGMSASDWPLRDAGALLPQRVQGVAGQVLRVPWFSAAPGLTRADVALFELRAGAPAHDRYEHVARAAGYLELRDLPPGDHLLLVKDVDHRAPGAGRVAVRVTAGEVRGAFAAGASRVLERADGGTLQIVSLRAVDDELVLRLAGTTPRTRVRVHASRYLPGHHPFAAFERAGLGLQAPFGGGVRPPTWRTPFAPFGVAPAALSLPAPGTDYSAGRRLSDEYRYVLERRRTQPFPGNMLQRPSLLLNPWELEEWSTAIGLGGGAGGRFGGRAGLANPASRGYGFAETRPYFAGASSRAATLDFLGAPAELRANLRPDEHGVVRVPRALFGDRHLVHAVAHDGITASYRSLALPEQPLEPLPTRLTQGLDPAVDHAQTRGMEFVAAGESAVVADAGASDVAIYGSLADVFALFRSAGDTAELDEFAFLLRWRELDEAAKRSLYSEHACHELHVFLHQKDQPFFAAVVRPYLENKLHKQFIDHWLLGDDLRRYLEPWAFARLNVVERILLARRLEDHLGMVQRRIAEALALQQPGDVDFAGLLRFALRGRSLAREQDALESLDKLREELSGAPAQRQARAPGAERRDREPGADGFFRGAGRDDDGERESAFDADPWSHAIGSGGGVDHARARQRRGDVVALYRAPLTTRRYVEQGYWQVRVGAQNAELIEPNRFWEDFAAADPGVPFVSGQVLLAASGTLAEQLLALAFLDLPFTAGEHRAEVDGRSFTLQAATPLLLAREQIAAAERAPESAPVLVSQNVYRLDEPFEIVDGQRVDAYLRDELLVGTAYGCRVAVTNPTSASRSLEALLQIPTGALPVDGGFVTRGVPLRVEPYATRTIEFAFYFPAAGEFTQYPARITAGGAVLAVADNAVTQWTVRTEPSRVDRSTWSWVSQNATDDELLAWLDEANLQALDLDRIAWRMGDRELFRAVIDRLRARQVYADTLWSYAILHHAERATREYLRHQDAFLARCGPTLRSPLVEIDPVERRMWEFAEFRPLSNPRAHRFGDTWRILNDAVAEQYFHLLAILVHRPQLDSADRVLVTYYLLLQDRVDAALQQFARIDPRELPSRLQYDYMRAYLACYRPEQLAAAREIAARYAEHPVDRWRALFAELRRQLDEAAGVAAAEPADNAAGAMRRATDRADQQPSLDLEVDGRRLKLTHANIDAVRIGYYRMDVEFLFSAQPFLEHDHAGFGHVRPNLSRSVELDPSALRTVVDLPDELRGANVGIVVEGAGIVRRATHYANAMALRWLPTQGQVQVAHPESGEPLSKVYVKVFARDADGDVRFHKDGYTDLRGRFDYVSVSGEDALEVERLAVLVLSAARGAVIRELAPPTR